MKVANLDIAFPLYETPQKNGLERVEFLISQKKGEPLKSLNKISGGGGSSGIMLTKKNVFGAVRGQKE
ncbi:DNA repair protein RecN, partial [Staphylococcus hyicus]